MALYSAQHIDRLVTLYRAALQSERDFVMDLYGASIAAVTGNQDIPRPGADWPRVRVYVPPSQRRKVKDAGSFWRVEQIKPFRIFEDELAQDRARYVITFRPGCWASWSGPAAWRVPIHSFGAHRFQSCSTTSPSTPTVNGGPSDQPVR